jgi:hypothetical protein
MVYSSDFAGGLSEVLYVDFRDQKAGSFSIDEVARFLRSEKGFINWKAVSFPINFLEIEKSQLEKKIQELTINQVRLEYEEVIRKHQPLFISEQQLERFLAISTEDEFTQILLIPLLRHLGFVTAEAKGHRDKTLEFGQDIQRMKLQIPTKHWLYFSAQVKKGDIKASTKNQKDNVNETLSQTAAQLEWEMPDTETNQNVKPDHVFLIVSGDITEAAKQFIFNHSLYQRKRVLLWEKETIIRVAKEFGLPEQVQKIILEINKNHDDE